MLDAWEVEVKANQNVERRPWFSICPRLSYLWVFLMLSAISQQASVIAAEATPAKSGQLTVVGIGGAEAEVVIDYFCGKVVRNAARALVEEVQRLTGVALPI